MIQLLVLCAYDVIENMCGSRTSARTKREMLT